VARCACIDIGSNTTRLLVAEDAQPRPRELLCERAFTRLGSAREGGEIGARKIAEVAAVVARQVRTARELGAQELRIVATSAVREAADAGAMTAAIASACDVALEILSCEDEARLAFAGAVGMLAAAPPDGLLGVVDVGGGSTELVAGSAAEGVTWSVSLPLGSSVLTDADLPSDPPTPFELERLRARLATAFAAVEVPRPIAAYAVGGSASSLQRLLGTVLDGEALARGLATLVTRPSAEIALVLGLHAERARLLPAGLLLLDAASRAMNGPLQLAGGGLREGIVLEQLAHVQAGGGSPLRDAADLGI
jgi:exopolyphosphatase/guanosine-5'-triphosphate,3'-diphosphate pyrophosphatase